MTNQNFENNVMNTQTGGAPLPEAQQLPKDIKPATTEQPVTPNIEVNKTVNVQVPEQPVVTAQQPVTPKINQEFTKGLYGYANAYSQKMSGKPISTGYDEWVNKHFSSDQGTIDFYKKVLQASKSVPIPPEISWKNDYVGFIDKIKAPTQPIQEVKSVSEFVRSPFTTDEQTADVQAAAQQKIEEVKQKYGLPDPGGVSDGIEKAIIPQEQPKEKPLIEQMTVQMRENEKKSEEALKKQVGDITLKGYEPGADIGLARTEILPEKPDFLKFKGGAQDFTNQYKLWDYETATTTQATPEDISKFGHSPFYSFSQSTDGVAPIFDWSVNVKPGASATEHWTGISSDQVPLSNVYAYGYKNSYLNKMPASAQKIFDDYTKYQASVNPEETKLWSDVTNIYKEKSFMPEFQEKPEFDHPILSFVDFLIGTKEPDKYSSTLETAKKEKIVGPEKIIADIELAFDHQKKAVLGEYYRNLKNGVDTRKQTQNALNSIENTKSRVYEVNPRLLEKKRDLEKKQVAAQKEQERADIKERMYREQRPFSSSVYYDFGGKGFEEGGKAVLNDFARTIDFISGGPSVLTTEMKERATPEVNPTSLQGSIYDEEGFHWNRLFNQSANTVTQMGGLVLGSKGAGGIGKLGKAITGIEKAEEVLPMFVASYNQTKDDYYNHFYNALKEQGYSDAAAEMMAEPAATRAAGTTSVLENLFGLPYVGKLNSGIKSDFSSLIKSGDNGYMAAVKSIGDNSAKFGKQFLGEATEEVAQDAFDKINNTIFNRQSGVTELEENMTAESVRDLLAVTGVSVLTMGAGANMYQSTPSKKAAIWNAVQDPAAFDEQLSKWVENNTINKAQAASMKEGVKGVKSAIEGLPSAKELNDKQKLDLGLLIYEKKKLDEEVKGGYVDELFLEKKTAEIEGKKKKLNDKILEVYNQNIDREKILAEVDKLNKEKQEAQDYSFKQLNEARARVLENVTDLESEEAVINKEFQPTGEKAAMPETRQQYKIEDGHHRYIAYKESGIEEVQIKTPDGEIKTVSVEQLKPTEPLKEKKRKTINSLKKAIDKGEPIEPIKAEEVKITTNDKENIQGVSGEVQVGQELVKTEPIQEGRQEKISAGRNVQTPQEGTKVKTIGPNNDIAINDSARKALDEYDFLKSKEDAGDKTFSPTKKYRGKIPFKGTGEKASANVSQALPIAEKEVRDALSKEGYSDQDIQTILDKSRKKEIVVNTRSEAIIRREAAQEVAKKEKKKQPKAKKEKPVEAKAEKPVEKPRSRELYDSIVKNKEAHERAVEGIETDRAALREEAGRSDNPEFKKGLESIEKALGDPRIKEPKDLKVEGELFGSWLLRNRDKFSDVEYNTLKERFSDLKEKFGKKAEAITAIEKIKQVLESLSDIKFVGTGVVGMNIFTIPINMPLAVVKGTAKVMLKAMDAYQGVMDYKKVGNEAVDAMRKTKWFQNLPVKERAAINKFIKDMEPFEAMVTIIDEAARDYKTTGERVVREIEKKSKKETGEKIREAKTQRKSAKKEQAKETKKSIVTEQKRKEEEKSAVRSANLLRTRLRKRLKSPGIAVNDKDMIGFMLSIDPRELFRAGGMEAIIEYQKVADMILTDTASLKFEPGTTKLKSHKRMVSNQAVSDFVEKQQALIEKYNFNKFKADNASKIEAMQGLGFLSNNPSRQEIETAFEKFNILDDATEQELKENAKKSPKIANKINEMDLQVKEDIGRLKERLNEGGFDQMSVQDKKIVENITNLDVSRLSPAQMAKAAYTINNIIVNKEAGLSGAGQVEAMAISHMAEETINGVLKKHNLKTLRDIRESYHNLNFKNTPQVLKAIGLTNEIAAEIKEALKLQELGAGYSNMMTEISKEVDQKIRRLKKRYGNAITRKPENRIRQGMYAIALQWQGDSVQDQEAWFEENKELLRQDIEAKKKSGKFEIEVAIEEKIFNEVFEKADSMEELTAIMEKRHSGDKAMVDLIRGVFDSNKKGFERASRIYGNQELDMWNNYSHRKWKENVNNKWQEFDPINKDSNIARMISGKNVNRKTSKSTVTRTEQWPDDRKVLNLDFFSVQNRMIHEAFYQAKTLGTRYAIKEIMENPGIKKLLGEKSHNVLKQRVIEMINHQMGATSQDLENLKGVKKVINFIIRWQTAKALAGLGQAPLQFATALMGATVKNPYYIKSTIENIFRSTKDTNLFEHSNLKSRANAYYEGGIESIKDLKDNPVANRVSRMFNDFDVFTAKGAEFALKPLQKGDFVAAKAAWMSYYKRKWKKDHPGEVFNWNDHYKNPDKTASAYADQMIQTSMNVNDIGENGNFFRTQNFGGKIARTIISPFASFAVNQDYRILDAFRNMGSLNEEATIEAAQDIASIMAEQITWQYMKAAIASSIAYGAAYALPSALGGGEEEEKNIADKRLKDVFTTEFLNKSFANAALDFIPTSGIVTPFGVNTVEGLAKRGLNDLFEQMFGEDYKNTFPVKGTTLYPDTNLEPDVRTAMAMEFLGMFGSAAYDIYQTGKIINVLKNGYKTKDGDTKELTQYQKNVLTGRLLTNLFSFSTGFSNKEWDNMLRYNEYEVKNQLKKGSGGTSTRGSRISGTRVGGTRTYGTRL